LAWSRWGWPYPCFPSLFLSTTHNCSSFKQLWLVEPRPMPPLDPGWKSSVLLLGVSHHLRISSAVKILYRRRTALITSHSFTITVGNEITT